MNRKVSDELLEGGIGKAMEGDYAGAIWVSDGVLETEPSNATAWNHRGMAQTLLLQNEEAIRSFDISLRLERKQAIVWFSRGMTRIKLRQFQEAKEDLDAALKLDEGNSDAWFYRSVVHAALDHHEQALMTASDA